MKLLKLITGVAFLAVLTTSCHKTSNQGKMIPREAGIVVVINAKSITSKLNFDEIKQTSWFKDKYNDSGTSAWNRKMMENPDASGIDMKADQVFFLLKNANQGQAVYVGEIKDKKAFEEFNKRFDSTSVPTRDGNINILKIRNKAVLGWDDNKFVYVGDAPNKNPMNMVSDSTANSITDSTVDSTKQIIPIGNVTDNLVMVCKRIFGLNSDSSLYKDEKFAGMIGEEGDVHLWVNAEQLSKGSMSMGMVGMMKVDKFFEGNVFTSTANFDNGKITIKQKTYTGKDLTDILKKYNGGNVNADMLKNLPAANVAAAFALHFKPEALYELIKLTGLDGLLNIYMGQAGMSIEDFIKANKGDIALTLSDLKVTNTKSIAGDTTNFNKNIPEMNLVFAISIADKDAFNKLITAAKKITGNSNSSKIVYKNTGQYFVIGNKQAVIDNFVTGNKTSPAFTDKVRDHPGFGYIDIQTILKALQPASSDSIKKQMFDMNFKMWDNIYLHGGDFSDGGIVGTTEINLIDKSTNSLKQLNKYFDQLYLFEKERKKNKGSASDSIKAPHNDSGKDY